MDYEKRSLQDKIHSNEKAVNFFGNRFNTDKL